MQPNRRIRGNVNEWQRLYTVEERYYRTVLFPDLPDERYVAEQVARMTENNRREAAELRALAERARTAGWQNIAAVYDHMAGDHTRSAEHTTTWLVNNNYAVPPEPTITLAADTDPHESVHHMIQHHERLFNEALERRRGERSSTVRGLHLMNATTAARHLSLLRMLDRDIEVLNRRTLSARLEWELNPTYVASNFNQLMTRIDEEESAIFRRTTVAETPAPEPVVVERIVERIVEKPVEVIVEKPVERIVERVVEKPVYIERIVYRDRPANGRVAGTRQTRPATRRRPAK
jgi:hypothetical protein